MDSKGRARDQDEDSVQNWIPETGKTVELAEAPPSSTEGLRPWLW